MVSAKIYNCRYNAFITLFYFVYSSFIKNIKDENCKLLIELNDLIIKLSKDVNDKNYYDIVIFLQKNKFDSNNYLIDEIINEEDDDKKADLIKKLDNNISIDTYSSGYVAQLFTVFKKIVYFNLIEKKYSECILCKKKKIDIIKESQPFLYINKDNIILKKIINIVLDGCKENYTYDCECRKNSSEDLLCTKVNYTIESYPKFLNILIDMSYDDLVKFKDSIIDLTEDSIILAFNIEYKLKGIIAVPSFNHYISIIFKPSGHLIDKNFKANLIYYHDGNANGGKICEVSYDLDWKNLGIPYVIVYELLNN